MGDIGWIVVTIAGLCIGIGLGFWLGKSQRSADGAKLAEARAELEGYKAKVNEHFSQSAAHFHAIGRQYRELYEHMAAGSEDLCKEGDGERSLSFPSPEAVAVLEAGRPPDAGHEARPDAAAAVDHASARGPADYVIDDSDHRDARDDVQEGTGSTEHVQAEAAEEEEPPGTVEADATRHESTDSDDLAKASSPDASAPRDDGEAAVSENVERAEDADADKEKRLYH